MKKIILSPEAKQDAMQDIKQFYSTEMDDAISDFKVENLLCFILEKVGPYIYNQAVEDCYQLMNQKVEEIYSLEKHRFR